MCNPDQVELGVVIGQRCKQPGGNVSHAMATWMEESCQAHNESRIISTEKLIYVLGWFKKESHQIGL